MTLQFSGSSRHRRGPSGWIFLGLLSEKREISGRDFVFRRSAWMESHGRGWNFFFCCKFSSFFLFLIGTAAELLDENLCIFKIF